MNSAKTCIAPCTESGEGDERRLIKESKSSGYSSGQSLFAIRERTCACVLSAPELGLQSQYDIRRVTGFCG